MGALTLIAYRKKEIFGIYKGFTKTVIKNSRGVIKAVIPPEQKQPSKKQKKIMLNCFWYNLEFDN